MALRPGRLPFDEAMGGAQTPRLGVPGRGDVGMDVPLRGTLKSDSGASQLSVQGMTLDRSIGFGGRAVDLGDVGHGIDRAWAG